MKELLQDPVVLGILGLLLVLIIWGIVKRLVKLVIVAALLILIYLGYLKFTGQEVPVDMEKLKEKSTEMIDKVKEKTEQGIKVGKKAMDLLEQKSDSDK